MNYYFFFSSFTAETKLLPPVMDDNVSSCSLSKIKHILLEYLFFSILLTQSKSLALKHFNFFYNRNISLQKAGTAICVSVILFHRKVGNDIYNCMVYGVKISNITLRLVQTTTYFQIVKLLHM